MLFRSAEEVKNIITGEQIPADASVWAPQEEFAKRHVEMKNAD